MELKELSRHSSIEKLVFYTKITIKLSQVGHEHLKQYN